MEEGNDGLLKALAGVGYVRRLWRNVENVHRMIDGKGDVVYMEIQIDRKFIDREKQTFISSKTDSQFNFVYPSGAFVLWKVILGFKPLAQTPET